MPLPTPVFRSASRLPTGLTGEDDQLDPSVLTQISRSALGGLSRIGNFLDLPGSMVRDTLALKNPFDQLLSPTTAENRTSGRDLLRQYGLAGRRDNYGNFFGGVGAEIALDPLTYLTFGGSALSKGGQAAKKLGILDDALRARVGRRALLDPPAAAASTATSRLGRVAERAVPGRLRQAGKVFRDSTQKVVGPRTARSNTTLAEALELTGKSTDDVRKVVGTENVDKLLRQPLGGAAAVQLPFGSSRKVVNGAVGETINRTMDIAGNLVTFSSPVRHLIPLFNKAARGAHTEEGIKSAIMQTHAQARASQELRVNLVKMLKPIDDAFENASDLENLTREAWDYLEDTTAEGIEHSPEFAGIRQHLDELKQTSREMRDLENAVGIDTKQLDDLVNEYFPRLRQFFDRKHRESTGRPFSMNATHTNQIGRKIRNVKTSDVNEMSVDPEFSGLKHSDSYDGRESFRAFQKKYAGRLPSDALDAESKRIWAEATQRTENEIAERTGRRRDTPKDWGDETPPQSLSPTTPPDDLTPDNVGDYLNSLTNEDQRRAVAAVLREQPEFRSAVDKVMAGPSPASPAAAAAAASEQAIPTTSELDAIRSEAAVEGVHTNDAVREMLEKAEQAHQQDRDLFNTIVGLDPRHAEEKVPLYNTNPVEAVFRRVESGNQAIAAANAAYHLAAERAVVAAHIEDIPAGHVSLRDTLEAIGLNPTMAEDHIFNNVLDSQIVGKVDDALADIADEVPAGARIGALHVPQHIADEIQRVVTHYSGDEVFSPIADAFDKVTNLFKGGVTSIFPAFHVRNLLSGQAQNYFGEAFSVKSVQEIARFHKDGVIKGLQEIDMFKGMSDKESTRAFAELAYAHGLVGNQGWLNEILGDIPDRVPLASEIPAGPSTNFRNYKTARQAPIKERWNPLNTRGVSGESNKFVLGALGQDWGNMAENMNRLAPFYKLLQDGATPGAAAMQVKMLQVDYSQLSKFERTFMRRLFPFYSFTRGVTPSIVKMLAEQPGGRMGQFIRGARLAKGDQSNVMPDYVAETAAIPLGQGPEGDDQYLTGFGLMMEDPFSFVGGGFRNAALEGMSRMNPLIKGPLEFATGTTFFQRGPNGGRPLTDLDPTLGRLLANVTGRSEPVPTPQALEAVIGNSPLARTLTTARGLTDSRKSITSRALNVLTGMKVSTVSESSQDAILRERAADIMRQLGGLEFTRSYAPDELLESLSPNKAEALQQLQDFMNLLAARAKARKEARQSQE